MTDCQHQWKYDNLLGADFCARCRTTKPFMTTEQAIEKARVEERGFCSDIIEAEAVDATPQMAQLLRRIAMMIRRGK